MMDRPLLLSSIIDYAAEIHPFTEIVSATVEGDLHRYGYADARRRIARLAHGLIELGVQPGDRVATLAWNGYRHFELYYAITGIGAVCHTINPRLSVEQLTYIVDHARDRLLFYDAPLSGLVNGIVAGVAQPPALIPLCDADRSSGLPATAPVPCYEALLLGRAESIDWPRFDENTAAGLCYTSGTTGDPKGALYSHRSTTLLSMFTIISRNGRFDEGRRILPAVPFFHVNAWGLPYSAPLSGCALVLPGPRLDGDSLFDLMDSEGVQSGWGVPTVWRGLLDAMRKRGRKPRALDELIIGGSAVQPPMIEAFELDFGIAVQHGWGMTEMNPIGSSAAISPHLQSLPKAELLKLKLRQGRRFFGVEMKIVDDQGRRLPHDGKAIGELLVRGPTVITKYFDAPAASANAFDAEGWFATGDVASISPDGYLTLVDRIKDLVKSGGEWISSVQLEAVISQHPAVAACAIIGMPDATWGERPVLIVEPRVGANITKEEVHKLLDGKLPKWQWPDDLIAVERLPLTSTGKIAKEELRRRYKTPLESEGGGR